MKRALGWALQTALSWISGLVQIWPRQIAYHGFGNLLALGIYALTVHREPRLNRRQRGAQRHMQVAFGLLTRAELRRLTWGYSQHLAWLILDFLRGPLMTPRRVRRRVDARDLSRATDLLAHGRGVICVSGHIGNWEQLAYCSAQLGHDVVALARPLKPPALDHWVLNRRGASGLRVVPKSRGLWALKKALRRNAFAGLNVDENTRRGGIFLPFFNLLAATNTSVSSLQRLTGAPAVVLTCHRRGPERWRIHCWDVIHHDPHAPRDLEARRVTQRILHAYERAIRTYPTQYLWALRRWETRP